MRAWSGSDETCLRALTMGCEQNMRAALALGCEGMVW